MVVAGTVDEIKAAGHKVVPVGNATVLVMFHGGEFHAVDNRCPHMGFPLHRGDIHDGLLDCHWHHARFGAKEHEQGWRPGLTILSALANVLDDLGPDDLARGLTKSLAWIATECEGQPPRRPLPSLHDTRRGPAGLRTWLRETIEVRDADGAERILRTLAEDHGPRAALDAVLACCTDHRYCDGGHTLDFAVKCEALAEFLNADGDAALMFTALVPQLVSMARLEETSAWRRPVDVAALVADAERELPVAPFEDVGDAPPLADEEEPARTLEEILRRLGEGAAPVALADAVTTAATRRILRFGTANEVPDWDTVHHTQTYANAVGEGLRRAGSRELFRGVLDGAMSVYLDRFLNLPPSRLPEPLASPPKDALATLLELYDRRASVDEVAAVAHTFLEGGGDPGAPMSTTATKTRRVTRYPVDRVHCSSVPGGETPSCPPRSRR